MHGSWKASFVQWCASNCRALGRATEPQNLCPGHGSPIHPLTQTYSITTLGTKKTLNPASHSILLSFRMIANILFQLSNYRPGVIVVVNKIPPRGRDDTLLHNISSLNQLISNMARDSNQNILCLDPCPKMFRYYAKDEVHLNRSGKRFYVYGLAKSLINFHWPQLQSTR